MRILLLVIACLMPLVARAAEQKPAPNGGGEALPLFRFTSYDIDPKNPKKITFQIFSRSAGRTSIVELEGRIPGTTWLIQGFEQLSEPMPDGAKKDLSKITLLDTTTNKTIVLTVAQPVELLPAPKK